jgi:adenylate cyclase
MSERLSGKELDARVDRDFTRTLNLSNLVGAVIVSVFLTLILPVRHPPPLGKIVLITWPPALAYLIAALYFAPRWGRAIAKPRLQWLREDRAPDAREQELVLRNPLAQMRVVFVIWAGGAILLGLINLYFSVEIAVNVVTGILMGGMVTAAISYLLGERAMRPVTARALEHGVPLQPVAPGVIARTVLAWALATGIPLIAIAEVAWGMVDGDTPLTKAAAVSVIVLALLALAVSALAIVTAAKSVAEPIGSVRRALAQVEAGQIDVHVEVDDASEIGLLQAGFNSMVAGLRERERLRDLFGRHVGEDVARRALEAGVELGGEVREAAVLFVDAVGSTALAASTPPHEVVARLNAFYAVVLAVIGAHGGWVNKFEGDGALCDRRGCALGAGR